METNPYTLSFGMPPYQYISRFAPTSEITEAFMSETPTTHVYMISGIRGSGKTVLLSNVCNSFSERDEWIVINLIPDTDMLTALLSKLYSRGEIKKIITAAKIDLSVFGLGVSIEKEPIYDQETALERVLEQIAKHGKKVLIGVDEIVNNENVRIFAATFQLLIRQNLPVFLLMTGLYENIYNLQNEDSLTFLYRAPKIQLEPLSMSSISRNYASVLNLSDSDAQRLAKLTKGYAFAYQVLGYIYWDKNIKKKLGMSIDEMLPEYDDYLENYVYEKIWSELSPRERSVLEYLAEKDEAKVGDIRDALELSSGQMSVYRDRLIKRGIIKASSYGFVSLLLPRFGELIKRYSI
ncbi:MAG: ATP-binding protein [Lachnospiraceae bacterium]|nr:ATP-binding protein [Lachnospiraceae bacterium]